MPQSHSKREDFLKLFGLVVLGLLGLVGIVGYSIFKPPAEASGPLDLQQTFRFRPSVLQL